MPLQNNNQEFISGSSTDGSLQPTQLQPISLAIAVPPVPGGGYTVRDYTVIFTFGDDVPGPNTPGQAGRFELDDISVSPPGSDISNLQPDADFAKRFTANLRVPANVRGTCTVTVQANAVTPRARDKWLTGPKDPVSKSFDFDTRDASANVLGADKVCSVNFDIEAMPLLNTVVQTVVKNTNAGGAFFGCLETIELDGYLYKVVQILKHKQVIDAAGSLVHRGFLDENKQAGAVLIRVKMADCSWELIKAYEAVSIAARSLTVKSKRVYWFEGSHISQLNEAPIGSQYRLPSREGVPQDYKAQAGSVYSIANDESAPTEIGVTFRSYEASENPHTQIYDTSEKLITDYEFGKHIATASPMVFKNSTLHAITGFGDLEQIDSLTSVAALKDNWQWIRWIEKFDYRAPVILTNQKTAYQTVQELASATATILSATPAKALKIRPRAPYHALLRNAIAATGTPSTLAIRQPNIAFANLPVSAFLLIDDEIFEYTGKSSTDTLRGLARGRFETKVAAHKVDTLIWFIADILSDKETPWDRIRLGTESRHLYNKIRLNFDGETIDTSNSESIRENGVHLLEVSVPIGRHQQAWARKIANEFLLRFQESQSLVFAQIPLNLSLNVGDAVFVRQTDRAELNRPCQILSVIHDIQADTTELELATFPYHIRPSVGDGDDDQDFVTDGHGDFL